MKLLTYAELLEEYKDCYGYLEEHELPQRTSFLKLKPFSVILEGEHNEFDSLNAWIKSNIKDEDFEFIYYGKTDYDYGCAEYFGEDESNINRLKEVIPNIYTLYSSAYSGSRILKTDGLGKWIEYDASDKHGIVVSLK